MAVSTLLVGRYAMDIYKTGNRRFSNVAVEYHQPVKQYAADKYLSEDIQFALDQGWITQEEYDETMALKAPEGEPTV